MELTDLMKDTLESLRRQRCEWVAAAAERHWRSGERYYIDDRVVVSASVRHLFKLCNEQAEKRT